MADSLTGGNLVAEVAFEVSCLIAADNLLGVWELVARIATLSPLDWGPLRGQLLAKFGARLSVRLLDSAIKEEQQKHNLNRAVDREATPGGVLPVIQVNGKAMRDQTAQALAALLLINDPATLFARGNRIVYIQTDERDRPTIQHLSEDALRGKLDRAANFVRMGDHGDVPVPPPHDVNKDILSLQVKDWRLPALDVLVEAPTLRNTGEVVETPGYDEHARLYYARPPLLNILPVPEDPTYDEIQEAVTLIDEAVCDFPFAPAEDPTQPNPNRANYFGLLLSPIIRPAITGCTPLALIDAPQAGTGKSLLAEVFAEIVTGRPSAMVPYPKDDAEMQKTIHSMLMASKGLICFDNLDGVLTSSTLALALTAREFEARILGVSQMHAAQNRATWLTTGNNIRVGGDMPRRCYKIRIDAESSMPYRGRKYMHAPLIPWIVAHRGELLRALLILARAWYAHGRPTAVDDPLGSFEEWHSVIGGILAYAGVDGFLANLSEIAEGDDATVQWERFELELHAEYGESWFSVHQIVERMRKATELYPCPFTLPDTLGDIDRRKEGWLENALGRSLRKRTGTRLGEHEVRLLRGIDPVTRATQYRVLRKD